MVPKTVYTYDIVSFSSIFYMLWTIKVWSGGLFLQTDYKGRISKPMKYKYLAGSYCDKMESRRACIVIFFICLYFFFEMEFSLEPLHHKKCHDKYIFTHPPNMSDWCFAWQNGYGCHPLVAMFWKLRGRLDKYQH